MSTMNYRNAEKIMRRESDHIAKSFGIAFTASWAFTVLFAVVSIRIDPMPWWLLLLLQLAVFWLSWSLMTSKLDRVTDALLSGCDCDKLDKNKKAAPPAPPEQIEFVQVMDEAGRIKYIDKRRVGG